MKLDTHRIIKERKNRAWSQQHLADTANLSLRTIQRIESTGSASPESAKSIAAALVLTPHDLMLQTGKSEVASVWTMPRFTAAISLFTICALAYPVYSIFGPGDIIADTTLFRFAGTIRIDQAPSMEIGTSIALRKMQIIKIDDRYKLVLISPDENSDQAETVVRLLKRNGTQYEIMHRANVFGSSSRERNFAYRVCDNESTFYNYALSTIPECGD